MTTFCWQARTYTKTRKLLSWSYGNTVSNWTKLNAICFMLYANSYFQLFGISIDVVRAEIWALKVSPAT